MIKSNFPARLRAHANLNREFPTMHSTAPLLMDEAASHIEKLEDRIEQFEMIFLKLDAGLEAGLVKLSELERTMLKEFGRESNE